MLQKNKEGLPALLEAAPDSAWLPSGAHEAQGLITSAPHA